MTSPPDKTQTITVDRLLAVQRAFDANRDVDEIDILLDSIVVVLEAHGPQPEEELLNKVCAMWPGAGLKRDRVQRAAGAGVAGGLIVPQEALDGGQGYAVLAEPDQGNTLRDRVSALLAETTKAVSRRCSEEFARDLTEGEAEHYTQALIDAVSAGIRETFEIYSGKVAQGPDHRLLPFSWDTDAIAKVIDQQQLSDGTREVLRALTLSALDPESHFGSDIVTHLASGYILHAFMARRDQASDVRTTGPLAQVWLLVDTPHLFTLTEDSRSQRKLMTLLHTALGAKMRVAIPQVSLDELHKHLQYVEASDAVDRVHRAIADGVKPYDLTHLVEDGLVSAWLTHRGEGGRMISWEEYRRHVVDMGDSLTQQGFNIRRLPDTLDVRQLRSDLFDELYRYLEDEPRTGQEITGPNRDSVHADSETMALATLDRRSSEAPFWPGAWILTPDRRLAPAYERFEGPTDFPLTITPAQMAPLLSNFVAPASARQLASAAATQMSHNTLLRVATRFPTSTAIEIAKRLRSDSGSSEVDLRVAQQTSIADLLGDAADGAGEQRDELAGAAVADRRARRREKLAAQEREQARNQRMTAERLVKGLQAELDKARQQAESREEAVKEASREEIERAEDRRRAAEEQQRLDQEAAQAREKVAAEKAQHLKQQRDAARIQARTLRRRVVIGVLAVVLAGIGVGLIWKTTLDYFGSAVLIGAGVGAGEAYQEAENETISFGSLYKALWPQLLSLVDIFQGLTGS